MSLEILKQPYPFTPYNESVKRNLYFSLFITVFLLIYRPFGLEVYSYERSYIIAGYGIIIFICLTLNEFLASGFLPLVFSEKNWKVIHQLCWSFYQLFFAGLACFIYAIAIEAFPANLLSFLKIELYVLLSSILPIAIFILLRQNYLLQKNLKEAEILDKEFTHSRILQDVQDSGRLIFTGDNLNEKLELDINQFYYITSQDNYYEVVWMDNGKVFRKLLRGTLAKAEMSVSTYPFIFRCHRAFIVNLKMVQSVEGNAQGYRLHLRGTDEMVAVSRSKGQVLHQVLAKYT